MSSPQTQNLVVLITGASSGFGALTARHLARAGHTVYASMRSHDQAAVDSIEKFASENKCDLRSLVLDVTSEESCQKAVDEVIEQVGHLDCVIHNAGHMCYGPTESFTAAQFHTYYDINCVGPQRLNRAVLPHMRTRHSGLMMWIGSTSTRGGTPPFLAPYFAAKAAMDALAVSYSTELSRFGIESCIIVPGAFTKGTNHFSSAGQPESKDVADQYFGQGQPYHGMSEVILERLAGLEPEWADVEEVARQIVVVLGMKTGERPFRVHVDPSNDGAETVNKVADMARGYFYERLGLTELLHVQK